jgi:muconolactone delta-isomerase
MLFFVKVRVDPARELEPDDLWDRWEKEAEAALGAMEAGKIVSLYKVAGQRLVVGILDLESHDEADRIFMGGLPMAHYLQLEEMLPVRDYRTFTEDVRRRWK